MLKGKEYTGHNDKFNEQIYYQSLLQNSRGKVYLVKKDLYLNYVLFGVFDKTIEKLTNEVCQELTVLDVTKIGATI